MGSINLGYYYVLVQMDSTMELLTRIKEDGPKSIDFYKKLYADIENIDPATLHISQKYWDFIRARICSEQEIPYDDFFKINLLAMMIESEKRSYFIKTYSWAVPDENVLREIIEFIRDESMDQIGRRAVVLSICSGIGLWEYLIQSMSDFDVIATDSNSNLTMPVYMDIQIMDGVAAVTKYQTDCLFISWPPYDEPIAVKCLQQFSGNKLVYVGEGEGGCTADDNFYRELDKNWKLIKTVQNPCWQGIYDRVYMFSRE